MLSRIKVNAVHAGLSQPPVPLSLHGNCPENPLSTSPNNNWSTAPVTPETTDATEVGWTGLSRASSTTEDKSLLLSTHTPPKMETALSIKPRLPPPSAGSVTFQPTTVTISSTQLPSSQFQLPSLLTLLCSTTTVSSVSQLVEPKSTTVSLPSVTELTPLSTRTSTSSETHGAQPGENKDTSDSIDLSRLQLVSAPSAASLHTLLSKMSSPN